VIRDRQKGAAAVEFALCLPALLLIIAGTVHLGRALHARGRLVDAVSFAARSEAIAAGTRPNGDVDGGAITSMINGRLAGDTDCVLPVAVAFQVSGVPPYRHLEVNANCTLVTPMMATILGPLGLNNVGAAASMPLDYEPPN
jgi:Flp pilus assembly pilin Flp